ncbi:gamma-glutamyl-gamma-aminobutyrate hydrolase family protein [Streptomyces sp. CRN 30]|uniref:gamma-glutamyl-gamma-aminobutyrate hydrolase family protein n=1 Tax=Streptomyces sp. CRN 30 TaxID=3075613 RepID=UPI002A80A375|nr:gamma-glutamyl-gamma-aminobutyrate hydrolase family protein [Streptomyces sp. CRN 30]
MNRPPDRPPRPLIAIPARFAVSTSALRNSAEVLARALVEAVWRAGGEPVALHPYAPDGSCDPALVADRLTRFDGVLLPGGAELAVGRYGGSRSHGTAYDTDPEQDGFDLALAHHVLRTDLPLLAICRGLHTVNVALGGTLQEHLAGWRRQHHNLVHQVTVQPATLLELTMGTQVVTASCFHRRRVDRMGAGLKVSARAEDGTREALELPYRRAWFAGVQWHPEHTARHDPAQQALFEAFVRATQVCR